MSDTRPQWRVVSYVRRPGCAQQMQTHNARTINEAFDVWARETAKPHTRVVEVMRVVDTWERVEEESNNGFGIITRRT